MRLYVNRSSPLLAVAMIIGAAPAAALAQSAGQATGPATGTLAMTGRVAPTCILGAPSQSAIDLGQLATSSGARAGRITTIAQQSVTLPGSFCNFAGSAVTVAADALVAADATTPPGGFARVVNYTATASNWAPGTASTTTAALSNGAPQSSSSTGATQTTPKLADIGVVLSGFTVPGDAILISGTYSGSITITLGPALIQ